MLIACTFAFQASWLDVENSEVSDDPHSAGLQKRRHHRGGLERGGDLVVALGGNRRTSQLSHVGSVVMAPLLTISAMRALTTFSKSFGVPVTAM